MNPGAHLSLRMSEKSVSPPRGHTALRYAANFGWVGWLPNGDKQIESGTKHPTRWWSVCGEREQGWNVSAAGIALDTKPALSIEKSLVAIVFNPQALYPTPIHIEQQYGAILGS